MLAKAVSIAYPLGDILLLAAAIRLAVDAGKRAPAFYLLVGSIVCLFVTDSLYGYALLKGTYNHQLIYDAGWIAYYVLWGAAALHPSMRTLEQPAAEAGSRLTPARLALLGGACLIAPGIRFVQDFHNPDLIVVIVASAALFLLVVARMAGLVRQEERAASRELALRSAGVELVAAAGHDQVYEAAISGVHRLLGLEAGVRLTLTSPNGTLVVAATRGGDNRQLVEETGHWLDSSSLRPLQIPFAAVPEDVCGDLRIGVAETVLVLPLTTRTRFRGHLVILAPTSVAPELLDSLQALATQISLAVEGASLAEDLHRRQSEARFRSLVAHSSDLITVLDADGIVTYQSPSIERVLGYRVEEIEGTQFDELLLDGRPAAPLPGDHRNRSRRDGSPRDRLLPAASRRDVAAVRGPAHRPARGRARPRHRPQQPRRQRAQGVRGPARASSLPRPGHEPRQPAALLRSCAARAHPRRAFGSRWSPSCSSTSTSSRRSTTAWATRPATASCARSRRV